MDLTKKSFLSKWTFLGSTKRSKKVQKGPEAPKPIFSEGGWAYWDILGHIGTYLGFFVPKGILGTGGNFV